jgi:hypothetical protein
MRRDVILSIAKDLSARDGWKSRVKDPSAMPQGDKMAQIWRSPL